MGVAAMARTLRTILLALLLVAVGSSAAWTANAGPVRDVPIKGWVAGADEIDFTAPGCPSGTSWSFQTVGTGNVSHLGKVDFTLNNCTTVQPSGVITINGGITFTAANGDMLSITHQGITSIEGDVATALYDWQVADGTGRFLGATGSGESIGITYIPDPGGPEGGTSEINLTGTIAYDASNRADR
jgi:hypothetical protein